MVHREHHCWVGNSEPNLFLCSTNRTSSLFHPWQYFLMVPGWTISKLPCSSAPVPPVSSGTGRNGAWWAVMQMCCCSSWSLQCEESASPRNLPSHSVWCGVFGIFWYIYGFFYFPGRVSLEDYREVLEQPFVVLTPQNPFGVLAVKRRSFAWFFFFYLLFLSWWILQKGNT